MDLEIEVPEYFICPISLQIMKDPVTATTGITYDRESIEHWLSTAKTASCPITKQPLSRNSDLTPNHTLRRLIQAWCSANAINGVDRIPTPKSLLDSSHTIKLIRDLQIKSMCLKTLRNIRDLACENERNRKCLSESGVSKEMMLLIIKCCKDSKFEGLEEALQILHLTWNPSMEVKVLVNENFDVIDSLTWVLTSGIDNNNVLVKTHVLISLKMIMGVAKSSLLERLNPNFFKVIIKVLKDRISSQAIKASLHILIDICPWGRNRIRIVQENAVFELIELELTKPEKRTTELIFSLLNHLCSCADGREMLFKHGCGIAIVSKRLLRVSSATDDRAVNILAQMSKYSGKNEVVMEMLRVGAVSKLCMVLQANTEKYLQNKARGVLRVHSNVWNKSPCIDDYLLTMHSAR